jgi:2-dehydro-3-deoxy-D-arabinonate dehydratase
MKIYKTLKGIVLEHEGNFFVDEATDWDVYINRDDLYEFLHQRVKGLKAVGESGWLKSQKILAPIGRQEVWAAGVTYMRSKVARMEESEESGAATFYDKVYDAERPELFFKATPQRVVGTNDYVKIRKDSSWDVPEPELTLVIPLQEKLSVYHW